MAGFTFEFKGFDDLLDRLKAAPENIKKEVGAEVQASAITVVASAISRSPIDKGALRAGINYKQVDDYTAEIDSNVDYSIYQEFGTGEFVSIPATPPGLADIAIKAKGGGKRVGYIHPHPYLFNSVNDEMPLLRNRIIGIIGEIV